MADDAVTLALRQAHVARAQCLASLATMDALIMSLTPDVEPPQARPRGPRTLGEDEDNQATASDQ